VNIRQLLQFKLDAGFHYQVLIISYQAAEFTIPLHGYLVEGETRINNKMWKANEDGGATLHFN